MSAVREYAKKHGVPMTAVKCSPHFDETKHRVVKGSSIPHKDWKKKGRFEVGKVNETINGDFPSMWMLDLRKSGMYVVDIDVKGDKKAEDVILPNAWDELMRTCSYVVQSGSGGVHFYFKLPEIEKDWVLHQKTKIAGFEILAEPEYADIDILTEQIIVEGSQYEYKGQVYKYEALKGDISDVSFDEAMWKVARNYILTTPEDKKKKVEDALTRSVEFDELKEHLNNIPNETANWNDWYSMGQTIFNVMGADGFSVFDAWSQKCPLYNAVETRKLYDGLTQRTDGVKRTAGSILFLSRKANEDKYEEIRARYSPLSYDALKNLLEVDHFFVEEPKPMYIRATQREILEYSPKDFKELLKNWNYIVDDEKEISFYESWSKDKNKRTYKKLGFFPDMKECPANVYNCYVMPEASFLPPVENVDLTPILHHIDVMSGNEKDGAAFILDYMAQIVQYPAILSGIAILLYSEQGAGKDIITQWFGSKVLGEHQYYMLGKASKLFGSFNSDLQGKLLVHCDEVNKETMITHNDDLKRIITNGYIRIEAKGKDALANKRSYARFFFTTNNRDALKIEDSNRRYAVFRSSSEHRNDMKYFNDLAEFLERPEVVRAFYDFLMKRDISEFHWSKIPNTSIYKEIKESSMDSILQWVLEEEDGFAEDDGTAKQLKTTEWLQLYNNWAVSNNIERASITSFGSRMSEIVEKGCGVSKQTPKNVRKLTIDRNLVVEYLNKNGYT